MKKFNPDYFFDLSQFKHAKIFHDCEFVWQVLPKIASYLKSSKLGKIEVEVPKDTHLIHPELISIGKGTVIEPGVYIKGPCIIGENCSIRFGAYIRGDVITGDACVIGHDTEIKNTMMLNGAQASHFAYLGDSVLGNKVNLGAGTKCANLKLDHKNIFIYHENETFDTGLRKFGAIIGDGSQLGCNSVTNPGALLGKQVFGYPCLNFGGFVPSDSLVKPFEKVVIKPKIKK